jgi:hypothetical protein
MQPAACGGEVRFAPDSLLEGDGFEPSVPGTKEPALSRYSKEHMRARGMRCADEWVSNGK